MAQQRLEVPREVLEFFSMFPGTKIQGDAQAIEIRVRVKDVLDFIARQMERSGQGVEARLDGEYFVFRLKIPTTVMG